MGEVVVLKIPPRQRITFCTACDGEGQTHGYGTNNPSERPSWSECELCRGTGVGPEPPCSPDCYCWFPLEDDPEGRPVRGLCGKDAEPEPIVSGEGYSAWKENLL